MQNYEIGRELGRGNFGVTFLARHLPTGELAAVKMIERGGGYGGGGHVGGAAPLEAASPSRIDANVEREILNQRALSGASPFVVSFREAFLTPRHLCIAMEYVAGGEVFSHVASRGRLPEREARHLFRQLVAGVGACHALGVAHRDLKLENTLLTAAGGEGGKEGMLKIADWGYSKRVAVGGAGGGGTGRTGGFGAASEAKSRVGTPAYIAPEIITGGLRGSGGSSAYDGRMADVWSLGVFLYVLVVGAYPFDAPQSGGRAGAGGGARDFTGVVRRIVAGQFSFPPGLALSAGCTDLISRLLVVDPKRRLPLAAVRAHPWFVAPTENDPLPPEVAEDPAVVLVRHLARQQQQQQQGAAMQTEQEICALLQEARRPPTATATATATAVAVASASASSAHENDK